MLTGKVALVPAGAVVAVETAAADKEGCLHSRQTCLAHCVFILFKILNITRKPGVTLSASEKLMLKRLNFPFWKCVFNDTAFFRVTIHTSTANKPKRNRI